MNAGGAEKQALELPQELPVLPVRGLVVFPMAVLPLMVGQERSVRMVDEVMRGDRLFMAVAQENEQAQPAMPADLYSVGTAALVRQLHRNAEGTLQLVIQGLQRVRIVEWMHTEPFLRARIEPVPERPESGLEVDALLRTAKDLVVRLAEKSEAMPVEMARALARFDDPVQVSYLLATTLGADVAVRQELLEIDSVSARLRRLIEVMQQEIAVRDLEEQITSETQARISETQREYLLREQLRSIQRELGEEGGGELATLRQRFEEAQLPDEARRELARELGRLERMNEASPEYGITRTWIDWMLALPWGRRTGGAIDLREAQRILDEDHYDLDKIKERIVEYLAVKKLRDERGAGVSLAGAGEADHAASAGPLPQTPADEARREPILCFVGPPGVGKTSLGQSIAKAMGRKFVRISLGGVSDESEIRGHRRTYIGALPGRFVQALRRAEAADPVFMLDEIDKLGASYRGDPSAALLEVLDPAQNKNFVDTYLGVAIDLSQVLFICTANTLETIPGPLLDRMEVVALTGYTEADKLHIARRYLLPQQIRAHGLREDEVQLDDAALQRIIRDYTREAGVRNLERQVAGVIRKAARQVGEGAQVPIRVGADDLPAFLGRPRFFDEVAERIDRPGIVTGLAWTPVGGDILFVEAAMMPARREQLILTGMLGDVMRESAQAALTYLRSNARQLGVDPAIFLNQAVHVHVPAGAIPKDGPSAGVAMFTALLSLVTGRRVRPSVAMTGEITLRGKVLPVGGIREKVLAAYRAGIRTVLLPRRNEGDLDDVAEEVRREMRFVPLDSVDQVAPEALEERATWTPPAQPSPMI